MNIQLFEDVLVLFLNHLISLNINAALNLWLTYPEIEIYIDGNIIVLESAEGDTWHQIGDSLKKIADEAFERSCFYQYLNILSNPTITHEIFTTHIDNSMLPTPCVQQTNILTADTPETTRQDILNKFIYLINNTAKRGARGHAIQLWNSHEFIRNIIENDQIYIDSPPLNNNLMISLKTLISLFKFSTLDPGKECETTDFLADLRKSLWDKEYLKCYLGGSNVTFHGRCASMQLSEALDIFQLCLNAKITDSIFKHIWYNNLSLRCFLTNSNNRSSYSSFYKTVNRIYHTCKKNRGADFFKDYINEIRDPKLLRYIHNFIYVDKINNETQRSVMRNNNLRRYEQFLEIIADRVQTLTNESIQAKTTSNNFDLEVTQSTLTNEQVAGMIFSVPTYSPAFNMGIGTSNNMPNTDQDRDQSNEVDPIGPPSKRRKH